MKRLSKQDFNALELLIKSKQDRTKRIVSKFLKKYYPNMVEAKEYIFAEGDIPIALVAHMDTVFENDIGDKELFYDKDKNVMFSPQGAGFDDKAGIMAIIQIVRSGLRPHVIFTTDEECGAFGAEALAKLSCPFSDLRYIIQLDRRGSDDCVFYDCNNIQFENYVESFGFIWNYGSFSDISVLCPAWGVAGVNLSIGYRDEHTRGEVLFVGQFLNTVSKVKKMLTTEMPQQFEYIPNVYSKYNLFFDKWYGKTGGQEGVIKCDVCKKYYIEDDMFPVVGLNKETKFYCYDCIDKAAWCRLCGEAYEKFSADAPDEGVCPNCVEEVSECSK